MTTKGLARQATDGITGMLLELPRMIDQAEANGQPVIVEFEPGKLDEAHQRLYATLGVLIRFVHPKEAG